MKKKIQTNNLYFIKYNSNQLSYLYTEIFPFGFCLQVSVRTGLETTLKGKTRLVFAYISQKVLPIRA
jgi:hypothetical protein